MGQYTCPEEDPTYDLLVAEHKRTSELAILVNEQCSEEGEKAFGNWTNRMISVGENSRYYEDLKGNEHGVLVDLGDRVGIYHNGFSYKLLKKDVELLSVLAMTRP